MLSLFVDSIFFFSSEDFASVQIMIKIYSLNFFGMDDKVRKQDRFKDSRKQGCGSGSAGSVQFFWIRSRIRIRRNFYNMDPAPIAKPTQIIGKSNFFLQKY